tara:strand:+ start:393 stop:629 length:237 start_codon:yes stop_codon:yes gene_type:complete
MIIKEDMKYTQLLDLEWTVKKATIPAQAKYDEYYKEYGKEELLTKIAYSDLKELREAQKTMEQVIVLLRDNDLYTNGA